MFCNTYSTYNNPCNEPCATSYTTTTCSNDPCGAPRRYKRCTENYYPNLSSSCWGSAFDSYSSYPSSYSSTFYSNPFSGYSSRRCYYPVNYSEVSAAVGAFSLFFLFFGTIAVLAMNRGRI